MHYRLCLAATFAAALVFSDLHPASAAFDAATQGCRASVARAAVKLTQATLKALDRCSRTRAGDAAFGPTDCTDIDQADLQAKVSDAEEKFLDAVSGAKSRCTGVIPLNALYQQCPPPCNDDVPAITTFADVGNCMLCLERANLAGLAGTDFGMPASPLAPDDARCQGAIVKNGARLLVSIVKDVVQCELKSEQAGGTSVDACTNTGFPSAKVTDAQAKTTDAINADCAGANFGNLNTCAGGTPAEGTCVSADGTASGQPLVTQFLRLATLCGNGTIESPEQCDDAGESATCDDDCTFAVCGDHKLNVTAGEQCDKIGCCVECLFAAPGTPCNDGSICTDPDICNATGSCIGTPAPAPMCMEADAGRSRLTLKNKAKNSKDKLTWSWGHGPADLTFASFGDPIANGYTLCIYGNTDTTPSVFRSIRLLASSRKWINDGKKIKYNDRSRYPDGATSSRMKPGVAAKAKVNVKARGRRLFFSDLSAQFIPTVGLELRNSAGACFGATFAGPFSDPARFSAKNE